MVKEIMFYLKGVLGLLLLSFVFVCKSYGQGEKDSFLYQSIHQNKYFESLADSFSIEIDAKHIFNFQKSKDDASKFYRVMFDGKVIDDKQESLTFFYESGKGVVFGKEGTIINKIEIDHKTFGDPKYTKAFSEPLNLFLDSINFIGEKNHLYTPFGAHATDYYEYFLEDIGDDAYKVFFYQKGEAKRQDNFFQINNKSQITTLKWTLPNHYKIPLADSIRISQEYIYLNDSIIMPIQQQIEYIAGYEDYYSVGKINTDFSNLMLNVNLKDSSLFKPRMMVETDTERRMSSVMSLSNEEDNFIHFHAQNDSLSFLDSIDKSYNAFDILNWTFIGYNYHNRKKHTAISLPPFISNVQFNMVEGWVLNAGAKFIKKNDEFNDIIAPDYRYSIDGSKPYARLGFKRINRKNKGEFLSFSMGSFINQLNGQDPFAFSTLLLLFPSDVNINKMYANDFLKLNRGIGKQYDWNMNMGFEFAKRRALVNKQNVLGVVEIPYFPASEMDNDTLFGEYIGFEDNKLFQFELKTNLTLNHADADLNNHHQIGFNYKTAIPGIASSTTDFTVVEMSFHGVVDYQSLDAFSYHLKMGQFLGVNNMYLMDYHHMNTSKMFLYDKQSRTLDGFYIMDYYKMSNNSWYAEAHFSRDFSSYMRKVELLSKFNLGSELHTAYVPNMGYYNEFVLSLSSRLRVVTTSFIFSFQGYDFQKVGLNIGITL